MFKFGDKVVLSNKVNKKALLSIADEDYKKFILKFSKECYGTVIKVNKHNKSCEISLENGNKRAWFYMRQLELITAHDYIRYYTKKVS